MFNYLLAMINFKSSLQSSASRVNILLAGNNPIELTAMADTLSKLPLQNVWAEIAFDRVSIQKRLLRFIPHYIFIDDNLGMQELTLTIKDLSTNEKTKNAPITILKNSNYKESVVSNDIMDYILKQQLTPHALLIAMKNSLKFRITNQLLGAGEWIKKPVV